MKEQLLQYLDFIQKNFKKKIYLSSENRNFLFNKKENIQKKETPNISAKKDIQSTQQYINKKDSSIIKQHTHLKETAIAYNTIENKKLSYQEIYQLLANDYNFNNHHLDIHADYLFFIPKSVDHSSLFKGKVGDIFRKMITALNLSSYQILIVDETNFDKKQRELYLTQFMSFSKATYNLIFSAHIFKSLFSNQDFQKYQGKNQIFSFEDKKFFSSISIQNLLTFPASMQQKYKEDLWQGLQKIILNKNERHT